ncbi:MAG TPA: aspartate kinase [Alloiococcus sp.]|nr:aspartate kinase [Alloiococcus sp.]
MKVAKFGGSSVSSAAAIEQVGEIVKRSSNLKAVIVSAPGKRFEKDVKVTDMLIELHSKYLKNMDVTPYVNKILNRYASILEDLGMSKDLVDSFQNTLNHYLNTIHAPARLLDALKSLGEDFNAQLIASYFKQIDLDARYLSPLDAGMTLEGDPGNGLLLKDSYQRIEQIKQLPGIVVIPGFFGYTQNGHVITFSRGGSDITGAIIARGIGADVYENYTDQNYIYRAHPEIVSNPLPICEITYQEMRELSYSGFTIFHDEALEPLYKDNIPIQIKNTMAPELPGTRIVPERSDIVDHPVIGISGNTGFISFTVKDYLLNRKKGYVRRLLEIFENYDLSVEHIPTGIDYISIFLRSHQFDNNAKVESLKKAIKEELQPEWVRVENNLGMVVVVGEGLRDDVEMVNHAIEGLSQNNIKVRMINQGASLISMFFSVHESDLELAVNQLYKRYYT